MITVCFENPARIPEAASREIWSPRGSPDGFLKDRDQIDFTMFAQRLVNFMTGLFFLYDALASGFFGSEAKQSAV